jgi:hypothetical protein
MGTDTPSPVTHHSSHITNRFERVQKWEISGNPAP